MPVKSKGEKIIHLANRTSRQTSGLEMTALPSPFEQLWMHISRLPEMLLYNQNKVLRGPDGTSENVCWPAHKFLRCWGVTPSGGAEKLRHSLSALDVKHLILSARNSPWYTKPCGAAKPF